MKIQVSQHPHLHLALPIFLIIVNLMDAMWYLIVILIFISLMTVVIHIFKCYLYMLLVKCPNLLSNFI